MTFNKYIRNWTYAPHQFPIRSFRMMLLFIKEFFFHPERDREKEREKLHPRMYLSSKSFQSREARFNLP